MIVPVPHLSPRFSLRDRETRGPMLDTEAETFGRVYLTDREFADFTAVIARAEKAKPQDWRRWRAVLESAGWLHPDGVAETRVMLEEYRAELVARVEQAEAERDALAHAIQLVPAAAAATEPTPAVAEPEAEQPEQPVEQPVQPEPTPKPEPAPADLESSPESQAATAAEPQPEPTPGPKPAARQPARRPAQKTP